MMARICVGSEGGVFAVPGRPIGVELEFMPWISRRFPTDRISNWVKRLTPVADCPAFQG